METPLAILQRYWKHDQFRPLQQDIVETVLRGEDVLALLPTGGGKSVCFQVPALALDGICLVITPLIALMKDQVEQLKKKGINAIALHSGMSRQEIDILLDNCVYGDVKFLYLSPERLQTELFIARVKRMKVALIAVDEAHCISQWGYDFRPPYLEIALLREYCPAAPVIALTASATAQVCADIVEKLAFRQPHQTFRKSFARDNISFVVRKTEQKEKKLLEILSKVKGSIIIYVRSRKGTQELAEWLNRKRISSAFYHAGLTFEERSARQDEWLENKCRVIVATNAFGMGIDKPDVRAVIHVDLPDNLEAYYQEAGRAGRDGKRSFAALLYAEADIANLRLKTEKAHPDISFLKHIYQCLANYFQLAEGSGEGQDFDFDVHLFSEHFNLHVTEVYSALKRLEEEGLLQLNESYYSPSRLHIVMDKGTLYQFQVANASFDPVIKMMLRLYGGELLSGFVTISEAYLAHALQLSTPDMVKILQHLNALHVLAYEPVKDKPQLTFLTPRFDVQQLPLDVQRINARKALVMEKMEAMNGYATNDQRCRMVYIQHYFDEHLLDPCNNCDVCITKKKRENQSAIEGMRIEVLSLIQKQSITIDELEEKIAPTDNDLFVDVVRDLVDQGVLEYDDAWRLKIVDKQSG